MVPSGRLRLRVMVLAMRGQTSGVGGGGDRRADTPVPWWPRQHGHVWHCGRVRARFATVHCVSTFSVRSVHGIGLLEVLGAIGIVLPGVVGVATVLVPIAAVGLVLLTVGAAVVNVRYEEANRLPINVVLIALAAFVAWGRFGPYPF